MTIFLFKIYQGLKKGGKKCKNLLQSGALEVIIYDVALYFFSFYFISR